MSTITTTPSAPAPVFDSIGYPRRQRFEGLTDTEVRQQQHTALEETVLGKQHITDLQAEEKRIADEIYNHPLNVLQRQLAQTKHDREQLEATVEGVERRAFGTLNRHQDPQIARSKFAVLQLLDNLRNNSQHIVKGSRKLKQELAVERCQTALQQLEALVRINYGESATAQLVVILEPVALTIPPAPDAIVRTRFERFDDE